MKIDCIITEYHRTMLLTYVLFDLVAYPFIRTHYHMDGADETLGLDINRIGWQMHSPERVGQVKSLDILMEKVETEYYLGLEEDWRVVGDLKKGIEEAIEVLENNPKCGSVSLRGPDKKDHNSHPVEFVDGIFRPQPNWNGWSGWEYAPSIRRKVQYDEIGSYGSVTTWNPKQPWESERAIGDWYAKRGYWFATTKYKYFDHVGGGQSTFGK